MPQLVTAWQGVSKNETEKAFKQAEEQYISAFQVRHVLYYLSAFTCHCLNTLAPSAVYSASFFAHSHDASMQHIHPHATHTHTHTHAPPQHHQVAGINDDAVLYDKYLSCMEGALATFKALAMGEPELTQEYEDKLRKGE